MDFALTDYHTQLNSDDWRPSNPYIYPIVSSTPTILNATFKDALGNTIGNSSMSYAFGTELNGDFSLDASTPFSSIDISWDAGSVTIIQDGGRYGQFFGFEKSYGNLLTANNFSYTQAVAVPEPETYAMMLAGLGMLGFTARRKKINQPA